MAISLVTVAGKITAALTNLIITAVNAQGTTSIIPTSVAGAGVSVGASGKVTFTAATSVSLNGCFTATYDDYLIKVKMTTHASTVDTLLRLRVAGVDSSATNYAQQRLTGAAAAAGSNNLNTQAQWTVDAAGSGATIYDRSDITLESPFLSAITTGETQFTSIISAASMTTGKGGLYNTLTTSFDGFTLLLSAGTMTGTIRIYGINNN